MTVFIVALIIMTVMGSVASLFLKYASDSSDGMMILRNRNLYIGGGLYFCSALLNIWILKYLDYSVVLPLTSLTYLWTMFLSYHFLKETITKRKLLGVMFILIGAVLVSMAA